MAILYSLDTQKISSLEIQAGEVLSSDKEIWQKFSLILCSGSYCLKSDLKEEFYFCRKPQDEVEKLAHQIHELIIGKRKQIFFEPGEPSIEMTFTCTHHQAIEVQVWLDASNAKSGIYSWDAAGIRFLTNDKNLLKFFEELKEEFGLSKIQENVSAIQGTY